MSQLPGSMLLGTPPHPTLSAQHDAHGMVQNHTVVDMPHSHLEADAVSTTAVSPVGDGNNNTSVDVGANNINENGPNASDTVGAGVPGAIVDEVKKRGRGSKRKSKRHITALLEDLASKKRKIQPLYAQSRSQKKANVKDISDTLKFLSGNKPMYALKYIFSRTFEGRRWFEELLLDILMPGNRGTQEDDAEEEEQHRDHMTGASSSQDAVMAMPSLEDGSVNSSKDNKKSSKSKHMGDHKGDGFGEVVTEKDELGHLTNAYTTAIQQTLEAVRRVHKDSPLLEKRRWLSIVAAFPRKFLRDFGFEFSNTQYTNARSRTPGAPIEKRKTRPPKGTDNILGALPVQTTMMQPIPQPHHAYAPHLAHAQYPQHTQHAQHTQHLTYHPHHPQHQ
jgi:hypothetical protein